MTWIAEREREIIKERGGELANGVMGGAVGLRRGCEYIDLLAVLQRFVFSMLNLNQTILVRDSHPLPKGAPMDHVKGLTKNLLQTY